ncbi:uncharacterized protein LOC5514836 isoform X2 [Nematostella vectensis]|uniref:uncharacterized protein LOC5514836 isoform X2 n=1 Tax=Nematostella vectensis TaxID=45351 RepID=UPI002076DDD3|nr:uncharacterized protein LOC5514836 isoform X2 [Nematostella vectensis]
MKLSQALLENFTVSSASSSSLLRRKFFFPQELEEHTWTILHHGKLNKAKGRECVHECSLCLEQFYDLLSFTSHLHSDTHQEKYNTWNKQHNPVSELQHIENLSPSSHSGAKKVGNSHTETRNKTSFRDRRGKQSNQRGHQRHHSYGLRQGVHQGNKETSSSPVENASRNLRAGSRLLEYWSNNSGDFTPKYCGNGRRYNGKQGNELDYSKDTYEASNFYAFDFPKKNDKFHWVSPELKADFRDRDANCNLDMGHSVTFQRPLCALMDIDLASTRQDFVSPGTDRSSVVSSERQKTLESNNASDRIYGQCSFQSNAHLFLSEKETPQNNTDTKECSLTKKISSIEEDLSEADIKVTCLNSKSTHGVSSSTVTCSASSVLIGGTAIDAWTGNLNGRSKEADFPRLTSFAVPVSDCSTALSEEREEALRAKLGIKREPMDRKEDFSSCSSEKIQVKKKPGLDSKNDATPQESLTLCSFLHIDGVRCSARTSARYCSYHERIQPTASTIPQRSPSAPSSLTTTGLVNLDDTLPYKLGERSKDSAVRRTTTDKKKSYSVLPEMSGQPAHTRTGSSLVEEQQAAEKVTTNKMQMIDLSYSTKYLSQAHSLGVGTRSCDTNTKASHVVDQDSSVGASLRREHASDRFHGRVFVSSSKGSDTDVLRDTLSFSTAKGAKDLVSCSLTDDVGERNLTPSVFTSPTCKSPLRSPEGGKSPNSFGISNMDLCKLNLPPNIKRALSMKYLKKNSDAVAPNLSSARSRIDVPRKPSLEKEDDLTKKKRTEPSILDRAPRLNRSSSLDSFPFRRFAYGDFSSLMANRNEKSVTASAAFSSVQSLTELTSTAFTQPFSSDTPSTALSSISSAQPLTSLIELSSTQYLKSTQPSEATTPFLKSTGSSEITTRNFMSVMDPESEIAPQGVTSVGDYETSQSLKSPNTMKPRRTYKDLKAHATRTQILPSKPSTFASSFHPVASRFVEIAPRPSRHATSTANSLQRHGLLDLQSSSLSGLASRQMDPVTSRYVNIVRKPSPPEVSSCNANSLQRHGILDLQRSSVMGVAAHKVIPPTESADPLLKHGLVDLTSVNVTEIPEVHRTGQTTLEVLSPKRQLEEDEEERSSKKAKLDDDQNVDLSRVTYTTGVDIMQLLMLEKEEQAQTKVLERTRNQIQETNAKMHKLAVELERLQAEEKCTSKSINELKERRLNILQSALHCQEGKNKIIHEDDGINPKQDLSLLSEKPSSPGSSHVGNFQGICDKMDVDGPSHNMPHDEQHYHKQEAILDESVVVKIEVPDEETAAEVAALINPEHGMLTLVDQGIESATVEKLDLQESEHGKGPSTEEGTCVSDGMANSVAPPSGETETVPSPPVRGTNRAKQITCPPKRGLRKSPRKLPVIRQRSSNDSTKPSQASDTSDIGGKAPRSRVELIDKVKNLHSAKKLQSGKRKSFSDVEVSNTIALSRERIQLVRDRIKLWKSDQDGALATASEASEKVLLTTAEKTSLRPSSTNSDTDTTMYYNNTPLTPSKVPVRDVTVPVRELRNSTRKTTKELKKSSLQKSRKNSHDARKEPREGSKRKADTKTESSKQGKRQARKRGKEKRNFKRRSSSRGTPTPVSISVCGNSPSEDVKKMNAQEGSTNSELSTPVAHVGLPTAAVESLKKQLQRKSRVPTKSSSESYSMFSGHTGAVCAIKACDGYLYTCSADKTTKAFDIQTGNCVKVYDGHHNAVNCLEISEDRTRLFTGSNDQTVRSYNVKTAVCTHKFTFHGRVMCLHNAFDLLFVGLNTGIVTLVDLKKNACVERLHCHDPRGVSCLATATEGQRKLLCTGSFDATISIRDSTSGLLIRTIKSHTMTVLCLQVVENFIYSGAADNQVLAHNLNTGELVRSYKGHTLSVSGLQVVGRVLVSSCLDKLIRCYDLASAELLQVYGGHKEMIFSVHMFNGKVPKQTYRIYSGARDGKVVSVKLDLRVYHQCLWKDCNLKYGVMSHLTDHVKESHIKQGDLTSCGWEGCDGVFSSDSIHEKLDIARHILSHVESRGSEK